MLVRAQYTHRVCRTKDINSVAHVETHDVLCIGPVSIVGKVTGMRFAPR